jgi:hypothetical protein
VQVCRPGIRDKAFLISPEIPEQLEDHRLWRHIPSFFVMDAREPARQGAHRSGSHQNGYRYRATRL